MTDDLVLVARGRKISGWEDVSVTLHCEEFPPSFEIGMSWRDPVTKGEVIAAAGDDCQVYLGDDLVITGFIDHDGVSGDAHGRRISLSGRGKTQDLVDCSAEWAGGQITGDALSIAQKLASAYSLNVALANGASAGPQVVGWALNYSEQAAPIIQRVAQNAGLLAYEDNAGRLLLAKVGTATAEGGISYGGNVESWSIESSMDQRFSEIVCCSFSTATFNALDGSDFFHSENDPNVPRHRRLDVIRAEVAEPTEEFTIRLAKWQIARRAGRSTLVHVVVDSWRDAGGMLWTPNTLVPVDLPGLRVPNLLCVSEVTFRRGADGTHADLTLMPPSAFTIEPINLLSIKTAAIADPSGAQ